jgi:hypothetical protein
VLLHYDHAKWERDLRKVLLALGLLLSTSALAQSINTSQVWVPLSRLASPVNVTNASSATQLPGSGSVAWLCNTGSNDAYAAFGTNSGVTASTIAGTWLKANACASYGLWPNGDRSIIYTWVALITASATTTVTIEQGNGTPPAF